MQETIILWADDEIDLLKPHILFLQDKGYKVISTTNGSDAIDLLKTEIDKTYLEFKNNSNSLISEYNAFTFLK